MKVLSKSTEARDRGPKVMWYRRMESLNEYGLVSQEAPHAEVFRRHENVEFNTGQLAK